LWPREAGALATLAQPYTDRAASEFEYYADFAATHAFEEYHKPTNGEFGLLVREPVGVVGAIVPWNGPVVAISHKLAPALLCGCTVVLKSSPEAPGEGLIYGEIAEEIGLPRRVQRGDCQPRRVRNACDRSPGGQDLLHRIDSNRSPHRCAMWRTDRTLQP
jgi:acyl-CoA reductase-like NAD-dependent aldehyde dehydrogenase